MTNSTMNETKNSGAVKSKLSPYTLSTELFKGKAAVPSFISGHYVFRNPHKISKIFPSIGLKNFKEPCEIARPLVNLQKENFVSNLITAMFNGLNAARDEAMQMGDRIQFLMTGANRTEQLGKIDDIYNLAILIRNLLAQMDMYNNAYEKLVQISEGKIVIRLINDVHDRNGKAVFKKQESLFKVFAKLREQFTANHLNFINLDQTPEFKTFCEENVPNKQYMVVFSSEGVEGAYDLLTMSMRGIKSCQRWDGDHPRCLIGSIVSKYVGIIYITSGTEYKFTYQNPNGSEPIKGSGLKMMRRAIVRYVIDAEEGKPCLLIDKLYPLQQGQEVDEETLRVFMQALQGKTTLPVYFAPNLGARARNFYVPFEKIRSKLQEKEWTYQDTPLKTNLDFKIHNLTSSSAEDNVKINRFKVNLIAYMSDYFKRIMRNEVVVDAEISKVIRSIRMNNSIDLFCEDFVKYLMMANNLLINGVDDRHEWYRKYLVQFALGLKSVKNEQAAAIVDRINAATSLDVKHDTFLDFIFKNVILVFVKQELKTVIV